MATNDKAVAVLNELIETCLDGENGFRTSAEELKDANVTRLFGSYAQQRAEFAEELKREVRRLGGDPDKSGHATGAVHRGWINLKAALTGHDTHAVVAEAERGEDVAKAAYEKAIDGGNLPPESMQIVQRQFMQVKEAHDHVRSLRDQYAGKS
jgi:uncharacterized protein (TIGR02284 family)